MSIVNTLSLESNRQIRVNFRGGSSDELTNDPVFRSVLEKDALASQPTVSRFLTVWMKIP